MVATTAIPIAPVQVSSCHMHLCSSLVLHFRSQQPGVLLLQMIAYHPVTCRTNTFTICLSFLLPFLCCHDCRQALAKVDAATRELLLNSEGPSHGPMTYVGPGASMHRLCHQIISPQLNQVRVRWIMGAEQGRQECICQAAPASAAAGLTCITCATPTMFGRSCLSMRAMVMLLPLTGCDRAAAACQGFPRQSNAKGPNQGECALIS